jgi:hypothetical protein
MPSELFTLEEVAARFRVSRRTLQDFVRIHPYYRRLGRRKLFTEADIARLYEALPCSNSSVDVEATSGTSAVPSVDALHMRVRALLTNQSRRQSEFAVKMKS